MVGVVDEVNTRICPGHVQADGSLKTDMSGEAHQVDLHRTVGNAARKESSSPASYCPSTRMVTILLFDKREASGSGRA